MADFVPGESVYANGGDPSKTHSRESSMSSERSNKENTVARTNGQLRSSDTESDRSSVQLILSDGGKLKEESRTDHTASGLFNPAFTGMKNGDSDSHPDLPPRQPTGGTGTARHKVAKAGIQTSTVSASIPEEEITIPADGNLASFSADNMATFLRYMKLEDRLVSHIHRQGIDGVKFGRLKDTDLDKLQISKNPVVVFFRDRTAVSVGKKSKQRLPFVL